MGYTPKDWRNATTHEGGGDETTPISAAALEDLETRVTDYSDTRAAMPDLQVDYGAGGIGGDDTAEIQAAVDDLPTEGGAIWCPEGYYGLSDSIVLPSFCTLCGPGSGMRAPEYGINPTTASASFVALAGMNTPVFTNDDPTNGNVAIEIKDLRIHAPGTDDEAGILFDKVRRSTVSNVYIQGAATTSRLGIEFTGASEMNRISDCWLEACGIKSVSCPYTLLNRVEIASGGIYIAGQRDHQVIDCILYQDGVATGDPYTAWEQGIWLQQVTGAVVTGCEVYAYRKWGIYLNSSERCRVIGNAAISNSQVSANVYSGIALNDGSGGGCEENVVSANQCYDPTATQQKNGIVLFVDGTVDYNLITNNNCRGNVTNGILNSSGEANNVIEHNLGTVA